MFNDQDLVNLLTASTEEVAGAFRARGTPACMKIIEIMGINAARSTWGACSCVSRRLRRVCSVLAG